MRLGKELTGVPAAWLRWAWCWPAGFMSCGTVWRGGAALPDPAACRGCSGRHGGSAEPGPHRTHGDPEPLPGQRQQQRYRKLAGDADLRGGPPARLQRMLAPADTAPAGQFGPCRTLERLPLVLPVPPNAIRNLLDEQHVLAGLRADP